MRPGHQGQVEGHVVADKKCRHCGNRNPAEARYCNACGKSLVTPVPFDGLLAEGTVLRGAYVIEDVIGEGGMGVVYSAHHQTLRSRYAIKVLDSKLARHSTLRERFLEEARIQATLSHPNIVRVHDILDEGGVFGMVMEYIDGRTLDEYIYDEEGQLGLVEALNITVALLDAIGHAHRAGVIHRDLKPSNVLVVHGHDPEDVGGDVKVMDFGIAKILAGDVSRTVTGAKMGTPRYMAPEQVRNARDVDGRTDLYAIGLTLYEMVTGRHPFENLRDYDLLKAQVEKKPPTPSQFRRDLPSEYERVILRALAKRPESRFRDAEAFIDALVALDEGKHTLLRRGSSDVATAATAPAPSELGVETPEPEFEPPSSDEEASDDASVDAAPDRDQSEPAPDGFDQDGSAQDGSAQGGSTRDESVDDEAWSLGDTGVASDFGTSSEPRLDAEEEPWLEGETDDWHEDDEWDDAGSGRRWLFWLVALIVVAAAGGVAYKAFMDHETRDVDRPEPLSRDEILGGDEQDHSVRTEGGGGERPAPLVETVTSTTGRMTRLPPGEYLVGRLEDDSAGSADEPQAQSIEIEALDVDQTEVSVFQYQRCVAENVCPPLGADARRSPNTPVTGIGFASAEKFCEWAGKRLPTESEWEAAARAGAATLYPISSQPECRTANYGAGRTSECAGSNPAHPESVFARELGKNRLHLRQMAGNVWEWTRTQGRTPQERIVKGGSWRSGRAELRVSARRSVRANEGADDVGFRCVRPAP